MNGVIVNFLMKLYKEPVTLSLSNWKNVETDGDAKTIWLSESQRIKGSIKILNVSSCSKISLETSSLFDPASFSSSAPRYWWKAGTAPKGIDANNGVVLLILIVKCFIGCAKMEYKTKHSIIFDLNVLYIVLE